MVIFIGFILGLLVGGCAWYLERCQYDKLMEDYRKIVNEFSVRTGGKVIFRGEQPKSKGTIVPVQTDLPRLLTPDMAIAEAEAAAEREELEATLTEADLKHLRVF